MYLIKPLINKKLTKLILFKITLSIIAYSCSSKKQSRNFIQEEEVFICSFSNTGIPEQWEVSDNYKTYFYLEGFEIVEDTLGNEYLLDSLGNFYPMATKAEEICPETTALCFLDKDTLIQEKFQQLLQHTQLKILVFGHSIVTGGYSLKKIPSEISQLKNLEYLILNNDKINEIPPEIGQLEKLKVLHLNHNELSKLPPEIGQLENLEELSLTHNQLANLPIEIVQLP